MRKITLFLSLCLAFIGITGTAQTPTTSDAPTNGDWAENTTWYLIQNGYNGYVSPAEGYADNSGMLLTNSTKLLSADQLWCIVGNETDGYKFYNKGAGIDKFMGMTGSEANARMKMYTASEVVESVTTTFDFTNSGHGTGNISIKLHGSANNYWNYRNGYLALWNNSAATGTDQGSAFKFLPVADELPSLIEQARTAIAANSASTYFNLTDENRETLQDAAEKESITVDEALVIAAALQSMDRINTEIANDAKVLIGNLMHTDRYMSIKKPGTQYYDETKTQLGSSTTADWSTVWTLRKSGEGLFIFYNEDIDKYIGAVPTGDNQPFTLVNTEEEATAYTISASTMPGYCTIADNSFSVANRQNFHMVNWDGVVRWTASADASQFKFIDYTDDMATGWTNALIESVQSNIGHIGHKRSTPELEQALNNLEANKDNRTFYHAVEAAWESAPYIYPEAGKFYTIRGAVYTNKYMTEKYGTLAGENTAVYGEEQAENIVPTLWSFVSCEDEGNTDLYYIESANSGLYLRKSVYLQNLRMLPKDNEEVGKYDIFNTAHRAVNGAVTLVTYINEQRSDKGTVNLEDNGTIQSWNGPTNGNNWFIEEATEIPVTIGSTGYATLNLPFAVTVAEGVKAHTAVDAGATIELKEIGGDVIPANTPVILTGSPNPYKFAIVYEDAEATQDAAETMQENALSGTTVPETIDADAKAYILKAYENGVAMCLVNSDTERTIPANKAYLGSTQATVDVKRFAFAGEATGIEGVTTNDAAADIYYDLNGRRVLYPAHGVYVKSNGQKVFIK